MLLSVEAAFDGFRYFFQGEAILITSEISNYFGEKPL